MKWSLKLDVFLYWAKIFYWFNHRRERKIQKLEVWVVGDWRNICKGLCWQGRRRLRLKMLYMISRAFFYFVFKNLFWYQNSGLLSFLSLSDIFGFFSKQKLRIFFFNVFSFFTLFLWEFSKIGKIVEFLLIIFSET